jgi:hypothetical protein
MVRALDDIVNGGIRSREDVEVPGRAYVADFRSHMQKEDTAILPLAAKLLRDGIGQRSMPRFGTSTIPCSTGPKSGIPRSVGRSRAQGETAHAATTQLR